MSSFLRTYSPLLLIPAMFVASLGACEDDVATTTSTSTTSTTGGSGGTGAATSSTTTTAGTGGTGGATGGTGGVGGAGGDGLGGTPLPNTGSDTCPGDPYTINVGETLLVAGDTTNAVHDYQGAFCQGSTQGPDLVYAITLGGPGSLKMQVRADNGSSLNPTMFARPDGSCTDESNNAYYGCWNFFATHEEFAFDQPAAETFYVFIDGESSTAGPYRMQISLLAPVCGDGVTNTNDGETCDDGNTINGDGCNSTCLLESITLFDGCDGEPTVLALNQSAVISNNTTGYSDDQTAQLLQGCTGSPPQANGRDRYHDIIAGAAGTVTARIGYDLAGTTAVCEGAGLLDPGCWDYTLYAVGPDNCPTGPQVACAEAADYAPETISFPVQAGEHYSVVVDGYDAFNFGAYNLHVELTP